jgi:GATA-binding protein
MESLLGTKRPAENVHFDSLLRADPSNLDDSALRMASSSAGVANHLEDSNSAFQSSSFNFSYPAYEGIFELPSSGNASSIANAEFSLPLRTSEGVLDRSGAGNVGSQHEDGTHASASGGAGEGYLLRGSMSGNLLHQQSGSISSPHHEGLSAAAAAASAAMAEGYAQLSAANLIEESGLDYRQLMGLGLVYPLDGSPFTHVDPTQIVNFTTNVNPDGLSPASEWANGLGTSATASPESYNASNASTPPSTESPGATGVGATTNTSPSQAQGSRRGTDQTRKYISLQQGAQEVQRRKSISTSNNTANSPSGASADGSSTSGTPEATGTAANPSANQKEESNGANGGGNARNGKNNEDGEQPPTVCTNCQTTNTPLWRRDPEGQPLCKSYLFEGVLTLNLNVRQRLWLVLRE